MIYRLKDNRVFRTYLGGKHIDQFCNNADGADSNFPEDWTASVVRAFNPGREAITEGLGVTDDGIYVKELVSGNMKCLVKLLDSAERLVIQVHPTVDFAKEYFHSDFGKTECWYFLNCDKDACVYVGFKEGVTEDMWVSAFETQDISSMLEMLHRIPVQNGDCIFIAGGVPHAIGKGCFMIEVQEPSDLMGVVERATPSGRKLDELKLHGGIGVEKMLKMFHYHGKSYSDTIASCKVDPKKIADGVYEIVGNAQTDKFSIHILKSDCEYIPERENSVMIVIAGEGNINGCDAKTGERFFLNQKTELKLKGNEDFRVVLCC